jgi:hypothetical protein
VTEALIDLRREMSIRARWELLSRVVLLATGLVGVVGGTTVLLLSPSHVVVSDEGTVAVTFMIGAGMFAVLGSTVLMQPGPSFLCLTSTGIDVLVHQRRTTIARWANPKLRIVLEDFRAYAAALPPKYSKGRSGLVWVSPRLRGIRGFDLSLDAYEQILAEALSHRARVFTRYSQSQLSSQGLGEPMIRFTEIVATGQPSS